MDTVTVQTEQPRVRPLPRLAQVPGPGRADLGPSRVLPGERGVRLPRPASGLGQPDLDGPGARPPADPPARLAAVPRRGRGPLVPPPPGRPDRVRRRGRTPRTTCSGWPGPWSSTSGRPATSRSSTSGRPTSNPSSPSSPCPPGKHGMGFDPLRSSREDTVYRHCLKAIDLVLDQRMGAHGLPLMGTGDWNDGLDEIGSRGQGRERLARLLPLLHPRADGRRSSAGRRADAGRTTTSSGSGRSRRPSSRPGGATATSAPSTTTAPRSA